MKIVCDSDFLSSLKEIKEILRGLKEKDYLDLGKDREEILLK